MSTDYTSAEAIEGLLNENNEAFIDGLATAHQRWLVPRNNANMPGG